MPFEILLKRISPTLKRITYKLNGHFSFFNDEDLYQEALVRLWEDFLGGKLDDKTDSYILQGCYFHLKNYLRKKREKVILVSIEAAAGEEGFSWNEILPAHNFPPRLDYEDKGFTEKEKKVLSFCAEGLTMREIGMKLGISHVRVVKIKKNLRRKLELSGIK